MLSNEVMGWVALWILWGNTALVLLAALKQASALSRRRAELLALAGEPVAGERFFPARVVTANDGAVGTFVVDQLGRFGAGASRAIHWHDRQARSEITGGIVEADGRRLAIEPTERAEVWVGADEVDAASRCPSRGAFEDAYPSAKKTRGVERELRVPIPRGRAVWVHGVVEERDGAAVVTAPPGRKLLVSAMDPVVWLGRRARFVQLFVVPGLILGAAIPTALALRAPVFESPASKIGGLLGLIYFLVVLPAGTALRDFLREPSQRLVRGVWADMAAMPSTSTSHASEAVSAPRTAQPPAG